MFQVKGLKKDAECIGGCGKTAECYLVECEKGTVSGCLCPKCFLSQVRMRSAKPDGKPNLYNQTG